MANNRNISVSGAKSPRGTRTSARFASITNYDGYVRFASAAYKQYQAQDKARAYDQWMEARLLRSFDRQHPTFTCPKARHEFWSKVKSYLDQGMEYKRAVEVTREILSGTAGCVPLFNEE